jgi:hypothetical protein
VLMASSPIPRCSAWWLNAAKTVDGGVMSSASPTENSAGACARLAWLVDDLVAGLTVREFRWYRRRRHYSGWYWSSTMSRLLAYESRLELARVVLADHDKDVAGIATQPFQLIGPAGGRIRPLPGQNRQKPQGTQSHPPARSPRLHRHHHPGRLTQPLTTSPAGHKAGPGGAEVRYLFWAASLGESAPGTHARHCRGAIT